MRVLALLLVLAGCRARPAVRSAATGALTPAACGDEIPGFERVAGAPVILLGEMHGLDGPPQFALDLACRLALRRGEAALALEMPSEEQPRLDAFLASEGGESARAQLLSGRIWTTPMQSGGTSEAKVAMLEGARALIHAGLHLRVRAVQQSSFRPGDKPGPPSLEASNRHEQLMGNAVIALARERRGPVVMLVGGTHVQKAPDPDAPAIRWTAMVVRDAIPAALSLGHRYGAGEAWLCQLRPGSPTPDCGRHPLEDSEVGPAGTRWRIELFAQPGVGGIDGLFDTGPAVASDPAVKPSPASR